ncbi:NAD-dependent epimerase/dehydratase family protein [Saliphagus infecundisoli]|uniref:NAD-dependent epimerase/dehydratase family protein n=1 Tax=Saliphagus infecundisoli TaxID=1849069 RepID=A0ABD5QKA3_9EURY|nr:NAD(P)-dependent oxidoreductase [Saliphagus infecundisoli]
MSETVVVTGALGGAGSWIAEQLRGEYDVVAVDLELPDDQDVEGVDFRSVDLTEQGPTLELVLEADPTAVVHFGNIPHEFDHTGGHVFENNAVATFHALEAAGRADADVVWASSETVYGTHWKKPELPDYLPVDVDHPARPYNGYETSKLAREAAAERVVNRFDVSIASIRPSWIQYPGRYKITPIREMFDLESAERFGNLWSYVDVRDVVSLTRAAIEADFDGHEVFNAFAADNFLGVDTAAAIEAGFGGLPEECALSGEESGFSTVNAASVLGWEPEHSWRDAEKEDVAGPDFV